MARNFAFVAAKVVVFIVAGACLCSFARAGTIVSVTGPQGNDYSLGATDQTLVSSWSSSQAYANVSISCELSAVPYGPSLVTAYLMTQIGPGTTPNNQLASITVTVGTAVTRTMLFTGLNLGAGTYFLVLTAPASQSGVGIRLTVRGHPQLRQTPV